MIQINNSNTLQPITLQLDGDVVVSKDLIKNGSFDEIGTDQVENGSFTQISTTDVVKDGNFNAVPLGSELITNGNFATGLIAPWSATANGDGVVPVVEGSAGDYSVRIKNGASDGDSAITQTNIFEAGKTYELTYRIVSNANTNQLTLQGYGSLASTVQTHTVSIVGVVTRESARFKRNGANTNIVIADISIKEVLNLVTNGDFSATGTELVADGNFTLTGTQPENTAGTYWNTGAGWTISGGSANCNGTQTGTTNLNPSDAPTIVSGKSYLLSLDVTLTAGTLSVFAFSQNALLFDSSTGTKTLTLYFQRGLGGNLFIQGNADFVGSIDNVSIKELGQPWSVGTGWSIGEDKASVDTVAATTVLQQSSLSVVEGKSYKISGNVSSLEAGSNLQIEFSAGSIVGNVTANGVFTFYGEWGVSKILYLYALGTSKFSVTNISVQELGTDWTQGLGWSIGENKANSAQALGTQLITNGNFDATGTEIIEDGNFPSGTSEWTLLGGSSLSTGFATVVGMGSTASSALNWALNQTIVVSASKSYIVKFTARITSGSGEFYSGWTDQTVPQPFAQTITSSFVEYTYYKPANAHAGTYDDIAFSGEVGSTFEIKDITLKELGKDWTVPFPDWSIENNVATNKTGNGSLTQSVSIVETKSYKVSLNVSVYTSGTLFIDIGGATAQTTTSSGNQTFYFIAVNTGLLRFYGGSFLGSITNISVQEISTSYLSQIGNYLTAFKSYKIQYNISNYSAGSVKAMDSGGARNSDGVVTGYQNIGNTTNFRFINVDGYFVGSINAASAFLIDPNNYWTLESGWSYGENKVIASTTGTEQVWQYIGLETGKKYRVTFDMLDYVVGALYVWNNVDGFVNDVGIKNNGSKEVYFTYNGTDGRLYFRGSPFLVAALTNITAKELDPNDYWRLSTNVVLETNKCAFNQVVPNGSVNQPITALAGEIYKIRYEVLTLTSGGFNVTLNGVVNQGTTATETGWHTDFITAPPISTKIFGIQAINSDTTGTITNVSVFQVKGFMDVQFTNQLTSRVIDFPDVPILIDNDRYSSLSIIPPLESSPPYSPIMEEGMYLVTFKTDQSTEVIATRLAFVSSVPAFSESTYDAYKVGDTEAYKVYIK